MQAQARTPDIHVWGRQGPGHRAWEQDAAPQGQQSEQSVVGVPALAAGTGAAPHPGPAAPCRPRARAAPHPLPPAAAAAAAARPRTAPARVPTAAPRLMRASAAAAHAHSNVHGDAPLLRTRARGCPAPPCLFARASGAGGPRRLTRRGGPALRPHAKRTPPDPLTRQAAHVQREAPAAAPRGQRMRRGAAVAHGRCGGGGGRAGTAHEEAQA